MGGRPAGGGARSSADGTEWSRHAVSPSAMRRVVTTLREAGGREEGVLVIGSGFMTHSFAAMPDPRLFGHVDAFERWAAEMTHADDPSSARTVFDRFVFSNHIRSFSVD